MNFLRNDYLEKVCSFSNQRLVEEIRALESIIDADGVNDSMLINDILIAYDVFRDTCVERLYFVK